MTFFAVDFCGSLKFMIDIPYSRLLQVPDEENEFLNLEELKPHQLTELGILNQSVAAGVSDNRLAQNSPSNSIANAAPENAVYRVHHQTSSQPQQQPSNQSLTSQPLNHQRQNHHMHQHHQIHNQIYYDLSSQNNTDACSIFGSEMAQTMSNLDDRLGTPIQDQKLHQSNILPNCNSNSRKRKTYYTTDGSDYEEDTGDDSKSVRTTDENKKQNHSEIEKRRRDKMNTYITELSAMVPMCHSMSRKLDKLTVLRMSVQHLKTIRGAVHSYTEGHYKPTFLSDQELKMLILQAADGFLFVVGCDRGRILYVSESVSETLNFSQGDLLGQSWFDILHPKDVAKVKEQLSSSDLSPREKLIDAKTMLPVKTDLPQGLSRLCPGARRSFFCRMKCKAIQQTKESSNMLPGCHRRKKQLNSDKKYSVIQCTGYLKSWAPAKIGLEEQETDSDGDSCNLSCLVAVGRIPPNVFQPNITPPPNNYRNLRTIQFISRHAMDGKFLFVDQRATLVLGFLPQELLGTSMYEYYQHEDIPALAEAHKAALQTTEKVTTAIYRFRTKENDFVQLQSEWKSFKNPWTKDVEYLIAKNSVIFDTIPENNNFNTTKNADGANSNSNQVPGNFDFFNQSNGREMHRMINTHVEASKIGRQIAEQVLDYHRRTGDSSSKSSPDPDNHPSNAIPSSSGENSVSNNENSNMRSTIQPQPRINGTITPYNAISPNQNSDSEVIGLMANSAMPESPTQTVHSEGNDEAAMAVIMSLLEADAGLGGPVDFAGLPWPLP